ncbi:uncharacterized protein LOC100498670 isoform X3 [Nasonia vitripennis]|uniref:Genetic suppressor element-like domain-containing protein n=1 Tax=Nasonia vitripennis TaxID=7425 RepID=A0A7M7Q6L6_NASVI|nr:uncharacterized protein LOC100498670 isoform X3 [Nasonia vitripennis]
MGPPGSNINYSSNSTGYITEKMYVLLQLYLQNKNWNPTNELVQCFADLKETSVLPSASYLQMLVTRIGLNSQGRLILRESGKLIIPYEQFGNAVMMKHLDGPHGLHLTAEGTIRAIIEHFTIGKENFGMEKEFIVEMVQNCPNPTCRFYKNQAELSQKSVAVGSFFNQEHDTISSTLMRTNYSLNMDFQSNINIAIPSHSGTSLSETSDNRSNNSQRSYSLLLKKIGTKLHETSAKIVPTSDSFKLTEFLRTNSDNYENSSNLQTFRNSVKEFTSLDNEMWVIDADLKSGRSTTIIDALIDTIQLIQSLRSFLPPPHISVSSWKTEDKHGLDHSNASYLPCL